MKHDLIKTDDYLLVVDESEIKGWYYDAYINKVKHSGGAEYGESIITRNIIAHLPLNGSPILKGVDLLPALEDDVDVEKKAINSWEGCDGCDANDELFFINGYQKGYNKAKEKYKYTEEDIDKAYWAGMQFVGEDKGSYKEFIQSLSQPKMPVGFERYYNFVPTMFSRLGEDIAEPKTTTTPEGHTQWVGTYIYE